MDHVSASVAAPSVEELLVVTPDGEPVNWIASQVNGLSVTSEFTPATMQLTARSLDRYASRQLLMPRDDSGHQHRVR